MDLVIVKETLSRFCGFTLKYYNVLSHLRRPPCRMSFDVHRHSMSYCHICTHTQIHTIISHLIHYVWYIVYNRLNLINLVFIDYYTWFVKYFLYYTNIYLINILL